MKSILNIILLPALLLMLVSCSSIAVFDQAAYENATSLKVDALNLMAQATESYSSHRKEVANFMIELDKAYEYDRGRIKNEITVHQWDIMRDNSHDLLGGFIKEWKESRTLLPKYVKHKQTQIARAFDTIIGLESGKLKPSEVQE